MPHLPFCFTQKRITVMHNFKANWNIIPLNKKYCEMWETVK